MGYRYGAALCYSLKQFCKNTPCPGFGYIINSKKSWFERCLWCILLLFLFVTTLFMVLHLLKGIVEDPVVISLESTSHPIQKVAFPAISICNVNKISKRRAIEYANFLSEKINVPSSELFNTMKILGKLYDYELDSTHDFLIFQSYLDSYTNRDKRNNLYYIMKNLSTPCEELLYKCTWKGEDRNCSEMFEIQPTYEGFCCVFNYFARNGVDTYIEPPKEIVTLQEAGWHGGLTVSIYNEPDDYFYPVMSSVGVNVHIFDPSDYPDATSGSLIEQLIAIGTEVFLNMEPRTVYSVPEVRSYPISTRECIFDDEVPTLFGQYSLSNCLVQCKVESMRALCQCVPFMIPTQLDIRECTLQDIPCLNKYQDKWHSLYPTNFDSYELEREEQIGLFCPECYATCSDTFYHVSTNSAPFNLRGPGQQEYVNFSVIRIYFGKEHSQLYKQDVVFYWFEVLSNYGGILGMFLGTSFLSIMEFLYFITFRFVFVLKKFKV